MHKIQNSDPFKKMGYGTRHGPLARGKPAVRGKPLINKIRGKPKEGVIIEYCVLTIRKRIVWSGFGT